MREKYLSIVGLMLTVIYVFSTQSALAVPAYPEPFTVAQPDGTRFEVLQKGDEWQNWMETKQGFTVAKEPKTKKWLYVDHYKGKSPVFTKIGADKTPPGHLKQLQRPERTPKQPKSDLKNGPLKTSSEADSAAASASESPWGPIGPPTGNVVFLLAEFTDRTGTYGELTWGDFVSNNIADYYNTASYGNVTIQPANESSGIANNGVIGWLPLDYPHPDTGIDVDVRNQQLTKDAIVAADSFIDYASYDMNDDGYVDSNELSVVVIVAGNETSYAGAISPAVWGHQWSIFEIEPPVVDGVIVGDYHSGAGGYAQFGEIHEDHQATMGIMVHELGHLMFNFPDLYDYDNSSGGLGMVCVMAIGSWGQSATDPYSGETPVLPSAWIKHAWGWANSDTTMGIKSITAAGDSTADPYNSVVKLETGSATEYFLIENRQDVGYDRGFEDRFGEQNFSGLAIYHVDESRTTNDDDAHRLVSVEDARGMDLGAYYDWPNRLWYAGNPDSYDPTFSPCTIRNSNLYDGTVTQLTVTDISALGTVMTANIGTDTEACDVITFASWDFESGMPDGWTVIDHFSTTFENVSWIMGDPPYIMNNYTGGSGDFLWAEAFGYIPVLENPSTMFNSEVRTQAMDLSSATGTKLRFRGNLWSSSSSSGERGSTADVDVSTDGGNSWTNVFRIEGIPEEDHYYAHIDERDLSGLVDGEPSVMLRFHFSTFLGGWGIDDVEILVNGDAPVCPNPDCDGDGVPNDIDNCRDVYNPLQIDLDRDGIGVACDPLGPDQDNDGIEDAIDNCPNDANPRQYDDDKDGIGLVCDNPEPDADNDGIVDAEDNCPGDANPRQYDDDEDDIGLVCDPLGPDQDNDGIEDAIDNCPSNANPLQYDLDGDEIGLACDADTISNQTLIDRSLALEATKMRSRARRILFENIAMKTRAKHRLFEKYAMTQRLRAITREQNAMKKL